MGQKDKIQELVASKAFTTTTSANAAEVMSVLDAAAKAAAPGGMKGSITRIKTIEADGQFDTLWQMKGPGGVAQVMTFTVLARKTADTSLRLTLELVEYKWQKGSMFMSPTLNGDKVLKTFSELVVNQLSARPTDPA